MFLGTHLSAFEGSAISRDLIEAYLATEYRIGGVLDFALIVGRHHPSLATLMGKHDAGSATVVTAWNPYSQPRPDAENARDQNRLVEELDQRGLVHFPGHGADPTGQWPPEDSRLALSIDLADAGELGRRYRQNGIIWAGGDALPKLLLLR